MSERMLELCESIRETRESLGRWPTPQEICEWLHTSLDLACKALARTKRHIECA